MAVIGTIRQRLGGLLIFIIALAMLAFILMDMRPKGAGQTAIGDNIAEVNGEEISYLDFNERLQINENYMQGQMQGQALNDEQKEMVRTNTYNEMLAEKLKSAAYEKLGILVGDEEKKAMLFDKDMQHPSITSSFAGEDGTFNVELFKNYLTTLDLPDANFKEGEKRAQWNNFEKAIYKEKADKKYNTLIQKSIKVPTWMATALYNGDNTMANVEYVYLPYSDIANETITITDAELEAYLAKHPKEYTQEESVNLKYLTYPIAPSSDDVNAVKSWIDDKFASWKDAESDSLFIMASSETKWNDKFLKKSELSNQFADSIFASNPGSYFGPVSNGSQYFAYKVVDKKAVPDSLKVRHLLLSGDNLQSQEDVNALFALRDSLMNLIDTLGVPLSSLTAQFSDDKSNAFSGGDLSWVRPDEMVGPFNDLIFYNMKPGDIKVVGTQFGVHIVEVYQWGTTQTGVQLATLSRSVFASEETTNNIFAEASTYAITNNNLESFSANSEKVMDAKSVAKNASTLQGLTGNARSLVKWAFNAKNGEISEPMLIGSNFVIAVQTGKFEKGPATLENVRSFIEEEVRKEKKAAILMAKVSGADLNAIASSNSKSVQMANNISMRNVSFTGVGNEPAVAGAALGLTVNTVSKALKGENGVFVIKTTSRTDAAAATDLTAYKGRSASYSSSVQSKLVDALKGAAKIKDHSFDFF